MEEIYAREKIINAFDKVSSELDNDRFLVYANDNERKGFNFRMSQNGRQFYWHTFVEFIERNGYNINIG